MEGYHPDQVKLLIALAMSRTKPVDTRPLVIRKHSCKINRALTESKLIDELGYHWIWFNEVLVL